MIRLSFRLLVCCLLLALPFSALAAPLRIACVMDGNAATTLEQLAALLERLRVQPSLPDGIELPEDAQFSFNTSDPTTLARVDSFCRDLMQRKDIGVILSFDLYSTRALLRHNNGQTPVFILSGDDPVGAGVIPSRQDTGADNVSASLQVNHARQKIALFHKILHFKRLGLLYVDTVEGRISSRLDEARTAAKVDGFELVEEQITEKEAFSGCAEGVRRLAAKKPDAFFMGSLLCLDPDNTDLPATLAPMTAAGIPSLAQDSPEQAHAGALMALTKDTEHLARINAKKITEALLGKKPRSQPMEVPFYPLMSLNIAVASQLAFQPAYGLLAGVDIIFYTLRKNKAADPG